MRSSHPYSNDAAPAYTRKKSRIRSVLTTHGYYGVLGRDTQFFRIKILEKLSRHWENRRFFKSANIIVLTVTLPSLCLQNFIDNPTVLALPPSHVYVCVFWRLRTTSSVLVTYEEIFFNLRIILTYSHG